MSSQIFAILIAGLLTQNYVLSRFLGICPFLGVSKTLPGSVGMGIAVTVVMVCASAVTYPIYHFALVPLGAEYLQTIAFILIIALFVQLLEMFLKKYVQPLYKSLGVYLPLITTNCAVLGVALLNITQEYDFGLSVWNAFCCGAGFLLAMVLFSGVRSVLTNVNVPKPFQGTPLTLIAASITSMSFLCFGGIGS